MEKRKAVISGVVILTLALTSGIGVFASSSDSTTVHNGGTIANKVQISDEQRTAINDARISSMKEAVENLVENNTLTQEEADRIIEKIDQKKAKATDGNSDANAAYGLDNENKSRGFSGKRNGMLNTLTDEQKEALQTEQKSLYEAALSKLVTDGTITQDLADQLIETGHGLKNKMDLTDEQKTAIDDARTGSMKEAVANLVEKGTLTQTEADDILAVPEKKDFAGGNNEINKDPQKENGPFKDLSDEQINSLKEEIKTLYENSLKELVDEGIITQEIADHVQKMPFVMGHKRGHGFGLKDCAFDMTPVSYNADQI
jgi:predicted transcriptional regulator